MATCETGIINLEMLPKTHLLSRKATAKTLGIEDNTLATWASSRRYDLPYVRVGSRAFYKVGDILDFIERQTLNRCSKEVV